MNGQHSGGNFEIEKTYPGCLGRPVNLFEMNMGVPSNRQLNGSPVSRSKSDGSRISPGHPTKGRTNVSEFKNSFSKRKFNKTPMEMVIAQGKSKEVESRRDPPNLVAKLMGLEALPQQEPNSAILRNHSIGHPQSHMGIPMSCWEQQDASFHYLDPNENKTDCEIWQQSQKASHMERYEENINGRMMCLVRKNFIEAKRLSVNEKHRQSKQFQDALEVLSSNKDLFLKCLHEPHSMFSENLYSRQSDAHSPVTKRITILRPSKRAESNDFVEAGNKAKKIEKGAFLPQNGLDKAQPGSSAPASFKYKESPTQPTRIVVLRPTCKKASDIKAVGSPHSEQPMMLYREDFFRQIEDNEDHRSTEVAKKFTQQMHGKLEQHCKDETLISSVLLNSYVGDESSFNKSEHEYVDDHLSDSEAMSPVSRHSWDYVNRLGPYSTSQFTQSSYSPESSVCREAKKRLSERWSMMASNEMGQEQRKYQRSSSTLGEMLSFTETNKVSSHGDEGSSGQESKDSEILLVSEWRREKMDNSPQNLMRSKSVPVSSEFGTRLNIGSSVSDEGKIASCKEDTKERSAKSSFKGKVSSLFFSRTKRPGKENSFVSKEEFYSFPGDIDKTGSLSDKGSIHSPLLESSSKTSSSNPSCTQMMSPENGSITEKLIASGSPGENLDRPSPISVLGSPFDEDEHIDKPSSFYAKPEQQGLESPLLSIGSHLIDKSPPIGSIARSLSCNDSFLNTTCSHPLEKLFTSQETDEEEQECLFFIKELLSEAGLHGEAHSTSCMARWQSLQSPLDLSLRGNNIDFNKEKKLRDAKLRQKRAVQKLVFDYVNAALVDAEDDSHLRQRGYNSTVGGSASSRTTMLDEVWSQMKIWFSSEVRDESGDCGEEVGKAWNDHFRLEMDNLGKEIEERLLEELMWEVVVEFTVEI